MYTGILVGLVITTIMLVVIGLVVVTHKFIQRITKEGDHA